MQETLNELLGNLRSAAMGRNWSGALDAVRRILEQIGFENALLIGTAIVQEQLDDFESAYPQIVWPRACLERIAHVVSDTHSIDEPLEISLNSENFPEPGLNSFLKAVEHLWEAAGIRQSSYAESVVDAISGRVMSQATQQWGKSHPEQWEVWEKSIDEEKPGELVGFWNDSQVQQSIQDLWLTIAQYIEDNVGL